MTKKRKKYRPRADLIIDPFAAFRPVDKERATSHMLKFYSAIEAMANAARPTENDWRVLADCINLCEQLMLQGKLSRDLEAGLIDPANTALAEAGRRYRGGKNLRLSGAGLQHVRDCIEVYGQCLTLLTEREMDLARRGLEARILKIRRGNNAAGQELVVV